MRTERKADLLCGRQLVGDLVQGGMERLGTLARDFPEQVGLRLDVRVERAFLKAHGLGEVADRGAVGALPREGRRSLPSQLGTPRGHACARSAEMARKTSAAATWNPLGRPAEANVAAISSISPTQRQPLVAAEA